MTIKFSCAGLELQLHRWPLEQKNRSLQAWDAADELLIEQSLQALQHKADSSVLLLNDSFGALSCAIGEHPHCSIGDSYISQQAALFNRAQNQLSASALCWQDSLQAWPDKVDLVLLKVPQQHSYLRFLLQKLSQVIHPHTVILAAGKAKDLHQNLLDIFRQELGPVEASLQHKKCRYLRCHWHGQVRDLSPVASWALEEYNLSLSNYPAVFSREQLDIGARFLLEHLPVTENSLVADLGCGNGVLGLALMQQQPQTQLLFFDDSYQAIASAQASLRANPELSAAQAEFRVDDCMSQQPDKSLDWVICNPPFHQQQAVTEHIAMQMFKDAKRCLKAGGRLRVVANRHLPYYVHLKQSFGHCRLVAGNPKFVILEAMKRN